MANPFALVKETGAVVALFGNYRLCIKIYKSDEGLGIGIHQVNENNSDDPSILAEDARIEEDAKMFLFFKDFKSTNLMLHALEIIRSEFSEEESEV